MLSCVIALSSHPIGEYLRAIYRVSTEYLRITDITRLGVGHTYSVRRFPQTQIDSWASSICGRHSTLPKTNLEIFSKCKAKIGFSGEEADFMLLMTSENTELNYLRFKFGQQIATMLLAQNHELALPDAHLAPLAAAVFFLFQTIAGLGGSPGFPF